MINPWLILGFIGLVGASYGLGYYQGGQAKQRSYEAAQAKLAQEARENVVRIENQYEKTLRQIRAKAGGGCVSPVIVDAINGLPDGVR